jgi:uncharacterized membrane protein
MEQVKSVNQRADYLRVGLRVAAAALFVVAGANHFAKPKTYQAIVPPGFGPPAAMVAITGIAEIAGGLGLLVRPLRRAAGWGLIALLISVFPVHIYMLTARGKLPGWDVPRWALWARLPLQGVLIGWVWFVSRQRRKAARQDCIVSDASA